MTLHLEHVVDGADADARLANLARAFEHEEGVAGETVRWLLRELGGARAALVAIREAVEAGDADEVILECVADGLAIQLDGEI